MEELRLTFLVFGALAIAGILAHGLWTVRKQRRKDDKPGGQIEHKQSEQQEENSDSDFQSSSYEQELDELGLGPVRVVSREARQEPEFKPVEEPSESDAVHNDEPDMPEPPAFMLKDTPKTQSRESAPDASESQQQETVSESRSAPEVSDKTEHQTPTTDKPEITEQDTGPKFESGDQFEAPEQHKPAAAVKPERKEPTFGDLPTSVAEPEPKFEAQQPESEPETVASEPEPEQKKAPSLAERARQGFSRSASKNRKRRTPKVKEDQITMDFDDQPKEEPKVAESKPAEDVPPEEQEVLVLNVKTPDGKPITGDALLPALLTLGFKFGDQDIFHRHVNSNGKGPVLFSLANMFKPGVFDIDNMEHFTTQGVSLFMILPIDGDPHQVFNMMHNAARKLADEFGAQVLDGRRSALTKQSVQQYVEKIREFERRRMIRRNR
ncbi:Cell division protein ZipA [Saliniradius amylolyticus]|uniref:Cell division protein ZipA n=1 Tax=Saliniradius amylolyticus TaxID=2183582 RepID=A0A2S2E3H8_9ALTE|nr:cell division protein ZipA [Saliniradius amylolyticus]AWL12216.1 Cell division protein ZipA [Saliniradius amylolyticus]